MDQSRMWLVLGSILGGLAVSLGAMAAHGLDGYFAKKYAGMTREVTGVEVPAAGKLLGDFKTGAEYQMTHSLALLAVGLLAMRRPSRTLNLAGWCFVLGILLFSGSLYALTLTGTFKLGMIAPIGGTLLIVGWVVLAIAACRADKPAA